MPKTKLEILSEELEELSNVITEQFIEREILHIQGQDTEAIELGKEISALLRRKEIIEQLIDEDSKKDLEEMTSGEFFHQATIEIR